ncbi:MAG TPA: hypothetical protein DCS21_03490 [Gammaproteobacteria bacterium]|nr:hypothetical protein [Gammaproteobacteria bacterium]
MIMVHELRRQQREWLEQRDELDEAVMELTAWLQEFTGDDDDEELIERRERLAWLQRQHAGVLVMLGETERALLASSE